LRQLHPQPVNLGLAPPRQEAMNFSIPVDQPPVDQLQIDQLPVDQPPVDQLQIDQLPVDQLPVDQLPPGRMPEPSGVELPETSSKFELPETSSEVELPHTSFTTSASPPQSQYASSPSGMYVHMHATALHPMCCFVLIRDCGGHG
jgi:hypothetical protein